jgi:wyosine [tRNA(Phe)-imidazoG37] synthetase (radical SAM superfamily)
MHLRVYGPVPSRRLGQSIGVNNIPPKICSFSCVYCQLGRTLSFSSERSEFYPPEDLVKEVNGHVRKVREKDDRVDYLTFVPDGEPTLDVNLGREIELLKPLGIKIAVISNGSLIWRSDVREDLLGADWVSMKVDAVSERVWRKINRPHGDLVQKKIHEGMTAFSEMFEGELVTETMLILDVNDGYAEVEKTAVFLEELNPDRAYLAIPTRPPAEKWVKPADEQKLTQAFQIFNEKLNHVEYLIGYEGDAFAFTGNIESDLLSITSVHPMREEQVNKLLHESGSSWSVVEKLIEEGKMIQTEFNEKKFYMRKLPGFKELK